MRKSWTLGEIEDIRHLVVFENLTARQVAEQLGYTKKQVQHCCDRFNIKRKMILWEEKEIFLLKKLVEETTINYKAISYRFNRTLRAIKFRIKLIYGTQDLRKIRNIKFLNIENNNKRYSEDEIIFLQKNYYVKGATECSRILKRNVNSIWTKTYELKKNGYKFEDGFYVNGWQVQLAKEKRNELLRFVRNKS